MAETEERQRTSYLPYLGGGLGLVGGINIGQSLYDFAKTGNVGEALIRQSKAGELLDLLRNSRAFDDDQLNQIARTDLPRAYGFKDGRGGLPAKSRVDRNFAQRFSEIIQNAMENAGVQGDALGSINEALDDLNMRATSPSGLRQVFAKSQGLQASNAPYISSIFDRPGIEQTEIVPEVGEGNFAQFKALREGKKPRKIPVPAAIAQGLTAADAPSMSPGQQRRFAGEAAFRQRFIDKAPGMMEQMVPGLYGKPAFAVEGSTRRKVGKAGRGVGIVGGALAVPLGIWGPSFESRYADDIVKRQEEAALKRGKESQLQQTGLSQPSSGQPKKQLQYPLGIERGLVDGVLAQHNKNVDKFGPEFANKLLMRGYNNPRGKKFRQAVDFLVKNGMLNQ